jgi:predicted phage baseplate assembly protein
VARGNVILVDHGHTVVPTDPLGTVDIASTVSKCVCEGGVLESMDLPARFRPTLPGSPLTFAQPLPADASAARLIQQDPRWAVPEITDLVGVRESAAVPQATHWTAQRDLIESGKRDAHFVVEIDNDGRAHLRFGDGDLGRQPEAGTTFRVTFRTGNGPAGNVGPETLNYIVFNNLTNGVDLRPRNPLPARGGTAQESLEQVKVLAPHGFRKDRQRAINADDYAYFAQRNSRVQRAAGALRWTGSWLEAQVAIDPLGQEVADTALLTAITDALSHYRRMGHDVDAVSARDVPVLLEISVCVRPHYLRGHVEAALRETFGSRILSSGQRGFFHPDNLTFGEGILLSRIVAAAQAIEGVEGVTVDTLERYGEGPNGEIENGILPLKSYEIAQLDNDPDFPERGKFTPTMRGGR